MEPGVITQKLRLLRSEETTDRNRVFAELLELVYDDLKRNAQRRLYAERNGMRPTALVHEACERLMGYEMPFEDRQHFFSLAAMAMRRILVDHARRRSAAKRGGALQQSLQELPEAVAASEDNPELVLDVHRALESLQPDQIRLAELHFFAGFTMEESAQVMGLKLETARKRWQVIRLQLYQQLKDWQR